MKRQAEATIPTCHGQFRMIAYAEAPDDWMPHVALIHEKTDFSAAVPVRIHSECLTGDVFGSRRCDCGEQLTAALQLVSQHGGVLIYLRQEGRGIGLINKLKAYNLQDQGLNTADANTHLGFEVDARQYDAAVAILQDLGVKAIHLITNNPLKLEALQHSPVRMASRIPLVIQPHGDNLSYYQTKRDLMGHLFF